MWNAVWPMSTCVSAWRTVGNTTAYPSDTPVWLGFMALVRSREISGPAGSASTLRPRSIEFKAQIARALRNRVWPLFESGAVKAVIHQVFPLSEAARAHEMMEASQHIGKLVLEL